MTRRELPDPFLRPAPERDCPFCPRLVIYREEQRARHADWHNAPVPSFGHGDAKLLVVGLAPGVAGANRTGRPFTGDHAGEVLYPALAAHGFSNDRFRARVDDGLELQGCRITNAVRCVPPANKPLPVEIATCRRFLVGELEGDGAPKVVLALGRIAFASVLKVFGRVSAKHPFAHGVVFPLPGGRTLVGSYHCSRYNMNTGKLTPAMFDAVMRTVVDLLREGKELAVPKGHSAEPVEKGA